MNKKQFNRVTSLYRDGVSSEVCVTTIIEMSQTNTEASIFICKFFNEMIIEPLSREMLEFRVEYEPFKKGEKKDVKSSNGSQPTNMADQRPDEGEWVYNLS